ncbi:PIN domain-containing protein [Azotobacter beijerinckii]|uniref:PIN domain-containing protein n=1 Tax=Azotobacter beijerinckii TaxID=170623 RepID=A0A1I3YSM1_9GAMM|nr:PIN domain-containing protein [Azotobacter beijerinckii]SFA71198.1 PIN domain-containing protein [Azotobacter beijerinckii]SFK34927.1 PIN domain-containing protein [Azotobacter beijerinckii]
MSDRQNTLYVFPDTNILVQCKPLEELDWSYLGSIDRIVLILSRPVIGEIDQQKAGTGRLAKRARTANSLIRQLLDNDSISIDTKRKGPAVIVESGDNLRPSAGLDDQLDYTSADDKLVGTVHRYLQDHPDRKVLLLSHDTGPLMTARRLQVPYTRVPDEWLLSPENDEEQKRIRELEGQLKRYQLTEPKCEIKFEESPWEFKRLKHRPLTNEQVTELVRRLKEKYPVDTDFGSTEPKERSAKSGYFLCGTEKFEPTSEKEISDYRDIEYPKWLASCESLFRELHHKLDMLEPPLFVSVAMSNIGAKPADNVLVQFKVKGQRFGIFSPRKDDENQKVESSRLTLPPVAPKGRWVNNFTQLISGFDKYSQVIAYPSVSMPMIDRFPRTPTTCDQNIFYWKEGRPSNPVALVELTCQQWRHQDEEELFVFQLGLRSEIEPIKDALTVTVHAANLAEPVQCTQRVSILIEEVDIWGDAEALLDIQ